MQAEDAEARTNRHGVRVLREEDFFKIFGAHLNDLRDQSHSENPMIAEGRREHEA